MTFTRWQTASQDCGRPWQATSQLPQLRQIRQNLVSSRLLSLVTSKGMNGRGGKNAQISEDPPSSPCLDRDVRSSRAYVKMCVYCRVS